MDFGQEMITYIPPFSRMGYGRDLGSTPKRHHPAGMEVPPDPWEHQAAPTPNFDDPSLTFNFRIGEFVRIIKLFQ